MMNVYKKGSVAEAILTTVMTLLVGISFIAIVIFGEESTSNEQILGFVIGIFCIGYGVYYSRWISRGRRYVAAMRNVVKPSNDYLRQVLPTAFQFSQYDLEANKRGEVTQAQRERLAEEFSRNRKMVFPIIVMLVGLGAILALFRADGQTERFLPLFAVQLIPPSLFLILMVIRRKPPKADIINVVEGEATLKINRRSDTLKIANKQFSLTSEVCEGD
jgi:fumarate reductase subunit D